MNLRDRIERAFERWARFVQGHRWSVILISLALAGAAASGVVRLEILASAESYLRKGDPEKKIYEDFRRTFDNDETVFFLLEAPDVFDPTFLARLRALHEDVEAQVPYVTKVRSLINARVVRGEGDRLIVEDLFEEWPETPEALAAIKARALANPLYRNLLLSEDGHYTIVNMIVAPPSVESSEPAGAPDPFADDDIAVAKPVERSPFLEQHELKRVSDALDVLAEKYRAQGLTLWISGGLPLVHDIMHTIEADMTRFSAIALAAIAVLLVILFRRVSGVVLPL
ncbi:MAG: MMPL family transporter, partial [Myxococcales bacterium]|nr:MMPL family transporter [Myxococcales bacterium]